MMTYPFHPLADLFPLIEGAEFAAFVEAIKEHGQSESAVLHEGKILDGRNRALACKQLGVPLKTRDWNGEGGTPLNFVISCNLHRRHLSTSQRAMIAAKLLPLLQEQAQSRMQRGKKTDPRASLREGQPGKAAEQAAAALNVSPRSVDSAAKVLRAGTPELASAVQSGKVSVSRAKDISELPAAEQVAILNQARKESRAQSIKEDRIADMTAAHKHFQKGQKLLEKWGGSGSCLDAAYREVERLRKAG
jgi:hypothetical protein